MFDGTTAALIRSAPPLDGLDLVRLPEELTAAYSELVAFRVTRRRRPQLITSERLDLLRRLANTYEALTVIGPPDENAPAAFIAATAHRLLLLATRVGVLPHRGRSALNPGGISADISAMLLFLISGYPSDAAEMARSVRTQSASGSGNRLLYALAGIGDGRLQGLLDDPLGDPVYAPAALFEDLGAEMLWHRLLFGIRGLIARLLGITAPTGEGSENPDATFRQVQVLATHNLDAGDVPGEPTVTALPGPYHLASLLARAGDVLLRSGVVNVDAPTGVDGGSWADELSRFARRRPYLWHNHLEAVNDGLLELDTSAVVSFPTGGGKSTLAELKAAATLLSGTKVLFLAPTHALVGQVTRQLKAAFPDRDVRNSLVAESYYAELEAPELPDVAVMTPERCLTLLGLYPETFGSLGLLIFDECHLLHSDNLTSKRGIDSMLALLGIIERAPEASLLMMSAMISNGSDLAGWLQSVLGRPCRSVSLDWKPTRQVRACVVYNNHDVARMNSLLASAKRSATTRTVPKIIRDKLEAIPFGLFGLKNTWLTHDDEDYALLALADESMALPANNWHLAANKNETAARLAASLALDGVRVLVFTQSVTNTGSIAKRVAEYTRGKSTKMTASEQELFRAASEECGGDQYVIGPIDGICAAHHSLLLPFERELNERIYSRDDGVSVLVATPTLAQGMNLPAEAVIIAGDDRFDITTDRPAQIEAHELLNAAGRAGRAGHAAQGLVVVVPGVIVGFNPESHEIGARWFSLQEAIFSKADNCLAVEDPIEAVLDRIHEAVDVTKPSPIRYFVNRLPIDADGSETMRLLRKSLGAYLAKRRTKTNAYLNKINAAVALSQRSKPGVKEPAWRARVTAATGMPLRVISAIDSGIEARELLTAHGVMGVTKQAFHWFAKHLDITSYLLGDAIQNVYVAANGHPAKETLEKLGVLTTDWMQGATLAELQGRIKARSAAGPCPEARKFVRRSVAEISYAIGLIVQIFRERQDVTKSFRTPLDVATVAACVREGVDTPELLAAHLVVIPPASRMAVREKLSQASGRLAPRDADETFTQTRRRVSDALRLAD